MQQCVKIRKLFGSPTTSQGGQKFPGHPRDLKMVAKYFLWKKIQEEKHVVLHFFYLQSRPNNFSYIMWICNFHIRSDWEHPNRLVLYSKHPFPLRCQHVDDQKVNAYTPPKCKMWSLVPANIFPSLVLMQRNDCQ